MLVGRGHELPFITDHEKTYLNQVYYFRFFSIFVASKEFNYSEQFTFLQMVLYCMGSVQRFPICHHNANYISSPLKAVACSGRGVGVSV